MEEERIEEVMVIVQDLGMCATEGCHKPAEDLELCRECGRMRRERQWMEWKQNSMGGVR